jgi:hypothetical protein
MELKVMENLVMPFILIVGAVFVIILIAMVLNRRVFIGKDKEGNFGVVLHASDSTTTNSK